MINVDVLPCADCMYFDGVSQPYGTEKMEYIRCLKASTHKAEELLEVNGRTVECDEHKEAE